LSRISGSVLRLSLSLLLGGCYGFAGGGLPPAVRTVAVIPFENLTADPALAQEINEAVREALERRLGLRQAGEGTADAIVEGSITRFAADVPIAVTANEANQVTVDRRLVQITVNVRISNRETGEIIWEQQGMRLEGDYQGNDEAAGRRKALERLTVNIVDGAQSQW